MNLLAFELSTERCSNPLLVDGDIRQQAETGNRPSRRILVMANDLLQSAGLRAVQLDAVAFGRGPGAFTGLRIAAGVAQGLAFGADRPLVPVSSLAALAQRAAEDHDCKQVVAALDARMNEIYTGRFIAGPNGLVQARNEEQLLPPDELVIPAGEWVGVGPAWRVYPQLQERVSESLPDVFPDAEAIARLGAVILANGGGVAPEEGIPVYLRDTVAWQKTR